MCILGTCPARIDARPAADDPLTHYIVVRSDLEAGVAAAQIAHAAGESSPGNLPAETFAVVLAAPDEVVIRQVAERLLAAGQVPVLIFESDPPWSGQLMAIGLPPAPRSRMRKLLSSLPLYRGQTVLGDVAQRQSTGEANPATGGSTPSVPTSREASSVEEQPA